jgi:hypothetical protein
MFCKLTPNRTKVTLRRSKLFIKKNTQLKKINKKCQYLATKHTSK